MSNFNHDDRCAVSTYEGECDCWVGEITRLRAVADDLRAALQDTFAMIDEGLLVRDISNDASPDYTMNMLKFVRRLAAAKQTLGEGNGD